jgi:hypothetical protein
MAMTAPMKIKIPVKTASVTTSIKQQLHGAFNMN